MLWKQKPSDSCVSSKKLNGNNKSKIIFESITPKLGNDLMIPSFNRCTMARHEYIKFMGLDLTIYIMHDAPKIVNVQAYSFAEEKFNRGIFII